MSVQVSALPNSGLLTKQLITTSCRVGHYINGSGKPCIIYTDHDTLTHTAALQAEDAADLGQGCSSVLQVPRRGNTVLMRGLVSISILSIVSIVSIVSTL